MDTSIKFSVVIPLYNKESYIDATLKSVFSQTYRGFEVVVVDDGSTDNGPGIILSYDEPKLRLIRQENAGVSAARNRGINEALFAYIAFLDADDEWHPDFLSTIASLIEKYPGAAMFATGFNTLHEKNRNNVSKIKNHIGNNKGFILNNFFSEVCKNKPSFSASSVCVRKEVLYKVGLFPDGINYGEDMAVWARVALKYKIAVNSMKLSNYYCYGVSGNTYKKYYGLKDRFDHTLLLKECQDSYVHRTDLEKYIEMFTLKKAALALSNGFIDDSKYLLGKIKPVYFKKKFYILKLLTLEFFPQKMLFSVYYFSRNCFLLARTWLRSFNQYFLSW